LVKSGKYGTSTLSLVQNQVRFWKTSKKSTLTFNGGSNWKMHHFLCQTEFYPVLTPSFLFPERLRCYYIYFHCSYMYNYYNYLEPCALNAETPYPNLIKFPYFADLTQRGDRGWKEAPRQGEDKMNLKKTLVLN
jgi:hypothetical protein